MQIQDEEYVDMDINRTHHDEFPMGRSENIEKKGGGIVIENFPEA
jgi:hypothetical protein